MKAASGLEGLTIIEAKSSLTVLVLLIMWKHIFGKQFEETMFIRIVPITLLQLFRKIVPKSQVIVKSIIDADDNFKRNSCMIWLTH